MKKQTKHLLIKKLLFATVIIFLFLPMIQQKMKLVKLKPLDGSYSTIEKPLFTLNDWLEGKFQTNQQDYLDQEAGFRSFLVRTYNQIYYSLFDQARANNVTIGKDNYLYDKSYINAYLGRDFIGQQRITDKIAKLQRISDTLRAQDIDIIVVFAPGKGSFYPEFIPDKYEPNRITTTNHYAYAKELKKSSIHFLDLNQWFRSKKNKSDYPLFPKTGIHWSLYGESLAMDTLTNYVQTIRKIQLPKMVIDRIEAPDTIRDRDDDIERGMNLLFDIQDLKMGYPSLSFQESNTDTHLKVITVADSYYWGVFGRGISGRIFKDEQFWYYNKEIHASSLPKSILVDDVNIQKEVEKSDVIILLFTDANLKDFAYGFIDQLYDLYFKPTIHQK
jgi:hypothetical protein